MADMTKSVNQGTGNMSYDALLELIQGSDLINMSYSDLVSQLQSDLQPLGIDGAPVDNSQPAVGGALTWNGMAYVAQAPTQPYTIAAGVAGPLTVAANTPFNVAHTLGVTPTSIWAMPFFFGELLTTGINATNLGFECNVAITTSYLYWGAVLIN